MHGVSENVVSNVNYTFLFDDPDGKFKKLKWKGIPKHVQDSSGVEIASSEM